MKDQLIGIAGWLVNYDSWIPILQIIVAAVTAWATFALWRVTRVLAKETKNLAASASEPFVVAHIECSDISFQTMQLVIENTGNAVAFDISIAISPGLRKPNKTGPLDPTSRDDLSVSICPPRKKVSAAVLIGHEGWEDQYRIEISWGNSPGSPTRHKMTYETSPRDAHRDGWVGKRTHDIGVTLEKIATIMEREHRERQAAELRQVASKSKVPDPPATDR